jgi:two-component system chemotaxis response regulator CheB
MKEKIKVMVVDDSAVVRETLTKILSADPDLEVIATAQDPIFAAKKLETLTPDVIMLDIEMPRMDGISFLRKLRASKPIPVVICSSKVEAGSDHALRALEAGAAELILKPKLGTKQFLEESKIRICDVVKAAHYTRVKPKISTTPYKVMPKLTADVVIEKESKIDPHIETTEKIVVVGASTGGTEALRVFLESYPPNAPATVIVQHMPEFFTASFAERLNNLSKVSVKEAVNGDPVLRGHVLIAPGNKHTLLKRSGSRYYVEVKDGPLVTRHRPSVDVLFRSASMHGGKNIIGVIMTGMGDDGARGMYEMKQAGAYNIAQDEESCVVFGMPAEAIKMGGVDKILPLKNIAAEVLRAAQ